MGLRVVDTDTAQVVGLKKAAARWAIGAAPGIWMGVVFGGSYDKWYAEIQRRMQSIQAEVEELNEQHADDPNSVRESHGPR